MLNNEWMVSSRIINAALAVGAHRFNSLFKKQEIALIVNDLPVPALLFIVESTCTRPISLSVLNKRTVNNVYSFY